MANPTSSGPRSRADEFVDAIFDSLARKSGLEQANQPTEIIDALEKIQQGIEELAKSNNQPTWGISKLADRFNSIVDLLNIGNQMPKPPPPPPPGGSASPPPPGPTPSPQPHGPTSPVSTFDRPQAVIVVGPRPLPVTVVGGQASQQAASAPNIPTRGLQAASSTLHTLSQAISAVANVTTAASAATLVWLDSIHAYTGAISGLNQMVEKFNPGAAYLLNMEIENLNAAMGRLLLPAVQQATAVIVAINTALGGLGPSSVKVISALAATGAVIAALAIGAAAAAGLIAGLAGAIGLLVIAASAIPIVGQIGSVLGLISASLAAIGVTGGMAAGAFGAVFAIMTDLNKVMGVLAPILTAFVTAMERISPRLLQIADRVAPLLILLANIAADFAVIVAEILSAKGAIEVVTISIMMMAASFLILLAPLIMLGAAFIAAAYAVHQLLAALGLIEDVQIDKKGKKTIAAAPATFMSAQSMAEKTYASAYSMGDQAQNPLLGPINDLTGEIRILKEKVQDAVAVIAEVIKVLMNPVGTIGKKIGDAVPNPAFRGFIGGIGGSLPGPIGPLFNIGRGLF